MKNLKLIFVLFLGVIFFYSCNEKKEIANQTFETIPVEYPEVKKDSIVEDYHGHKVADPYRWLEDDHADDTKAWVEAQNEQTFSYLDKIPYREQINERLTQLWNYEKFSTPFKRGDYYYFFKNDGLQNQSVLYRTADLSGTEEVVLDPNTFSDDGTASLGSFSFNKDGNLLAYTISEGGSDWRTAYVLDLETMKNKEDKVEWIKFSSLSWKDNGFYYSRYPASDEEDELKAKNEYHKVYYHTLGDDQSDDKLIYQDNDHPQRNAYAQTTDDERFLILYLSESTSGNALKVKDLTSSNGQFVDLVTDFDNDYSVIDNEGDKLYITTNQDAANQKIVMVDMANPDSDKWTELVAEVSDNLRGASIAGDKLFCYYLHNASSLIKVYKLNGDYVQDLELPGIGSIGGISGKKGATEAFYSFSSYTVPTSIYSFDTESLNSTLFKKPSIKFDGSRYVTNQVWYSSYDGTKVPMFVTHKKGIKLDGTNPTLLYGYGGFNIPLTPSFSISRLPLLENGGIYAVANIRGGGEFGSEWHKAGTLERKQNVFDDFQAAAEYLIAEKYTSSDKLAIEGGSNGGLLVGACITQRPDLYKVAFPAVGVLDMLRYHKFTIGWAWATDYGRSDDPEAYEYLIKYSPLHNVKNQSYPATLVTTADHDDRVVPAHSFKFISELQSKHNGPNPVLIRVETSAGHGAGKPTSKQIAEVADKLSFMFYNMNEPVRLNVKG